ncbi:MAG TPA: response regulator [bacterium]|jgi:DNA-binding NtrC family response regulator|nr:response regulator [bacterium]
MAKPTPKKRPAAKKPKKSPMGKAHLLVVDDEADFGKMIQKTLTQAGYRVDAATSATQAIALQRKHSYDLALVDMRMPEMTGLELLQYLKVRDKKIFVMIMTAYGSFSIGIEALRKGACDYVAKPFKLKTLKDKVAEAVTRRAQFLEEQRVFPQRATMDEW